MQIYKSINTYCYYSYSNHDIGHNIARALLNFGVESTLPCVHFIAGHEDIDHLDIWMTSFTCEPYIKVLVGKIERPLLWAILDELKIVFSGACGEKHMQASFSDSALTDYRVSRYSAKELISSICLYFDAMKRFKDER